MVARRTKRSASSALLAASVLFLAACGDAAVEPLERRVFLFNRPPETIQVEGDAPARLETRRCAEEYRRALVLEAGHALRLVGAGRGGARLAFEVGFEGVVDRGPAAVGGGADGGGADPVWDLTLSSDDGEPLWQAAFRPPREESQWHWTSVEVELPADAGGDLAFRATVEGAPGDGTPRPVLARPVLVCRDPLPPSRAGYHNVVLVLADTLRADHLGTYGNPHAETPFLDALADEALLFEDAQSSAPWTKASVASLLTSRHPSLHGAVDYLSRMGEGEVTLGHVFAEHGYRTAGFGFNKWVFSPKFNLGGGFERWIEVVDRTGIRETRGSAVIDEAIDWLDRHYTEPFLMYVHLIDPHAPFAPTARYRERFVDAGYAGPLDGRLEGPGSFIGRDASDVDDEDLSFLRSLYDAEIAYVDAQVARLAERMRRLGVWEESTFVFVSDHGEEFLEHGNWGHGDTLFQEQLHVPLLVKPPASAGIEPARVARPVVLLDVAPTVTQLSGIDVGDRPFLGRSLLAALRDPAGGDERVLIAEGVGKSSLRRGEWKYIVRHDAEDAESLYRLSDDPGELHDVLGEAPPGLVEELRAALRLHRAAAAPHGVFLELASGGKEARVRVFLGCDGDELDFNLLDTESDTDRFVELPGGRARLDLRLGPGDPRDVLVLPSATDATIELGIFVGDRPLAPAQIRLGPAGKPPPANPWRLDPAAPALRGGPPPVRPSGAQASGQGASVSATGVRVRLWRVEPETVELSAEEEAALRAIGY